MNNLVTIQSNVPICPECGAAVHLNPVNLVYSCSSCSAKHKVIDFGTRNGNLYAKGSQMKYIIMCGGRYEAWEYPRHLLKVQGEPIVHRTIRLLREYGVEDIAISSENDLFHWFKVPVLRHNNNYGCGGFWTDAFYPTDEPACYIFGDVVFSKEAIQTIVSTDTNSVEFFASAPPYNPKYTKCWAEPFAFKVKNQQYFRVCIEKAEELFRKKKLKRLISWELWQVIKGTTLNEIDYTNYTAINDFTCDVDKEEDLEKIERAMQ